MLVVDENPDVLAAYAEILRWGDIEPLTASGGKAALEIAFRLRPQLVLIDLWAREDVEGSIYGDITWTGYVGDAVPDRYSAIFTIVRDARDAALERVRDVKVVIFDKTGTLTKGQPAVAAVASAKIDELEVLRLAAAVEADSEHPLARAIVAEARRRGIEPSRAVDFESLAGRAARGRVKGLEVAVGGPRLLADLGLDSIAKSDGWAREGRTVLHVVADGSVLGALALEDEIRPESYEAVRDLHDLGLRVAMITGDSQAVADSVARRLGIDEVAAQVLPAEKAASVRRFQDGNRKVAFVGDGVNDAPALATADVGMAIGAGTDVAVESAGIVLVRSDPRDVVAAIELSHATYRKMIQNLVWATGYNLVAIPVAAGVLVPWGIDLPMAVGAIAMSASTIIVAVNAQVLRGLRLRPSPIVVAQPGTAAA